jgi:hypothetical protein
MLEGLILGVFLMTAEQATTPAAPAESQTSSSAAGDSSAASADPAAADPAAPASAPTTETPAPPADAAPAQATSTEDNHHRVRCRRGPPEIGSIMGRRICSSQSQDDERAQRDAAELRRMQQMQTTTGNLSTGN